jgi:hypothetical protein
MNNLILIILLLIGQEKNNYKNNLLGNWAESKSDNTSFIFYKDKMRFFDDTELYDYKLNNNIIKIYQAGQYIFKYKILSVTNSKLIIETEDKVIFRLIKVYP